MLIVRRVGALVLAVAAVAVWFGMAPVDHRSMTREPYPNRLGSGNEIEEAITEIGGSMWENGSYLYNLNENAGRRNIIETRTSALIGLGVLVIALAVFTTESRSHRGGPSSRWQQMPPTAAPPVV